MYTTLYVVLITHLVYSENYHVCLLTTTRTNQSGEYDRWTTVDRDSWPRLWATPPGSGMNHSSRVHVTLLGLGFGLKNKERSTKVLISLWWQTWTSLNHKFLSIVVYLVHNSNSLGCSQSIHQFLLVVSAVLQDSVQAGRRYRPECWR